jgi:hypothetical protein
MTMARPMLAPPHGGALPLSTPTLADAGATTKRPRARRPRSANAKLRRRIELAVERLLSALDALEAPAEDLEPEGDDGDDPGQDDEPDVDGEPCLGSTAAHAGSSQQGWSQGAGDDSEDEHDGAEPDEDGEPILGALSATSEGNQTGWGNGDQMDHEHDEAERGIADEDGALEQGALRPGQAVM